MKTKLLQNRFVGTFGTLKLYEKVITFLGFTPYCDWKSTNPIHAYSPGANPSGELTNLSTVDKFPLNYYVFDDSVVNGLREPILYSCVLDKPPRYKVYCEPET